MKTLYIECNMGAAGDMLMSALSELHPDAEGFMTRLSQIGIPDVEFERRQAVKCGIVGTHIEVRVKGVSVRKCMNIVIVMRNMSIIMSIITHIPTEVWLRLRISSLIFRYQTV